MINSEKLDRRIRQRLLFREAIFKNAKQKARTRVNSIQTQRQILLRKQEAAFKKLIVNIQDELKENMNSKDTELKKHKKAIEDLNKTIKQMRENTSKNSKFRESKMKHNTFAAQPMNKRLENLHKHHLGAQKSMRAKQRWNLLADHLFTVENNVANPLQITLRKMKALGMA